MADEFNITDHFNTDGTVNADGPGLATLAGPEHADTKCFDDVKDFHSFIKSHADTKSALGKKMENVIQKPGENATDADKAAYKASLKAELGAVKSGAEFEFVRPTLPAGMRYDEAMEAHFRDMFAQMGTSKEDAKLAFDGYNSYMIAQYNKAAEAEQKQIADGDEKLRTDWAGNDMLLNTRLAYQAMQTLGAEAFPTLWKNWKTGDGTEIKGLETRLKEARIFDSPGDLAKWRACGVDTSQLRLFAVIGQRMKAGNILTGDGTPGTPASKTPGGKELTESAQAEVDAVNAQTVW